MQRYKLIVEYDGTDFSGFQYQSNARSVQGELESALGSLLSEDIRVYGAGRTDAGVHASGMALHFDSRTALDIHTILKGANALLPHDIAVLTAEPIPDTFHARHSASSRSYRYCIQRRKRAIGRAYAWIHYGALDNEAIQAVVPALTGAQDFAGVSKRASKPGHSYCYVFDAGWEYNKDECVFTITANRFLYGMVRCIVGGLIQIGRGALSQEDFRAILESHDPAQAPMLAPAQGLTLTDVRYDATERATVSAAVDVLKHAIHLEDEDE